MQNGRGYAINKNAVSREVNPWEIPSIGRALYTVAPLPIRETTVLR